jgi:hypothetical protein
MATRHYQYRANPLSPLRSADASKVERWLGAEKIKHLQDSMKGWYGRPICLLDVPGSLWITADGDFVGHVNGGYFASAMDFFESKLRRLWIEAGRPQYGYSNVGFASISDALLRASSGYSQRRQFNKIGPTGVVGGTSSLWRVGPQPAAGTAPAAAPGGTAFTSATTGALAFANPASGTNHLVGADVAASVISNSLLVYDLIFGVAKTINSTTTEAVTGVPTRYQSTTSSAADYIGDNFGFVQVGGTALAATAHNWTVCTYTDQANAASTLPSLTGNSGAIVDRLDHPLQQWFAPLESGDVGIKAWTQMQCSAAVATGVVWFMIGHPLGFMSFPVINSTLPFDWLTNRDQAPHVFDNACVAFLEPLKPATTATTYTGRIVTTGAAA